MIARLRGKIVEQKDLAVVLDVGGIFYEVFIPASVAKRWIRPGKRTAASRS